MKQDERALTTAQVAQFFIDGVGRSADALNLSATEMYHLKADALDRFNTWMQSIRDEAVANAIFYGEETPE